jgi:hypothetical protein
LGSGFGEQLCRAALGGSFRQQLWEYLSGTAVENSFGEPLLGTGLKYSRFGVTFTGLKILE